MAAALASLSPEHRRLFASYGFGDAIDRPFECVHHAFEFHAAQQPHQIAVEHLADSISYGDLNSSANMLAARLRRRGVGRGSRVCLLVQRSIPMVVGILAALKAGAAYVPLDATIVTGIYQISIKSLHISADSEETIHCSMCS
jgi:non-ribosomal peptide synthetase component F